jgi:hypothetical protein
MTYRFEFCKENKILLLRVEGRVTEESLRELYWAIRKYSTATDANAGIWDLSSVTEFAVSPAFLRDLIDMGPAMPHATIRPRFLVAPTMVRHAVSRWIEIAGEHRNPLLRIVLSVDEALVALGVQSPHFGPLV